MDLQVYPQVRISFMFQHEPDAPKIYQSLPIRPISEIAANPSPL